MAFGKSNYMLQQQELTEAIVGLGLTRTEDPNSKLHRIIVAFPGARPMTELIRATTKTEALKFATNRYPTATNIEIQDGKHNS